MVDDTKAVPSAPEAIRRAFEFFTEFFDQGSYSHALLEGVEYSEPNWQVEIGYDLGTTRQSLGFAGMGDKVEPRRMVRTFVISEVDGSLVRMT